MGMLACSASAAVPAMAFGAQRLKSAFPMLSRASSSLAAMSLLASAVARAFGLPPATTPRVHVERDVRLGACDSVVLLTDLYLSRPIAPRPVILIRTPYGRAGAWGLFARGFAQRGYNVVIQSCRGTFGSGGDISFSAEAEDGRAAADWIVTQHWSNGEIGTFGPSYLSFVQWALASTHPPELKAMAIQIMSADRSRSYYPGGTFRTRQRLDLDIPDGQPGALMACQDADAFAVAARARASFPAPAYPRRRRACDRP